MDETTTLEVKVDTIKEVRSSYVGKVSSSSKAVMLCQTCGSGHNPSECPILGTLIGRMEQMDFVSGGQRPQGDPYSATYNPGWRNYPNF